MAWAIDRRDITVTAVPNSTMMQVTAVYRNNGDTVTINFTVSTTSEAKDTINLNLRRLQERDDAILNGIDLTPPAPVEPTPLQVAEQEYREAIALLEDLKQKADLDPTTFSFGLSNQRVITQQKLQALMALK